MIKNPSYKIDFTKTSTSELIEAISVRERLTARQNFIGGYTKDQRESLNSMTSILDQLINTAIEQAKPKERICENCAHWGVVHGEYSLEYKERIGYLKCTRANLEIETSEVVGVSVGLISKTGNGRNDTCSKFCELK